LILDPGLGFGKTRWQNYEILAHLERLGRYRLPLLVGSSKKSFIQAMAVGEGLKSPRQRGRHIRTRAFTQAAPPLQMADAGAVVAAILAGAHIVRVHEVAAMLPAVRLADALRAAGRVCHP
jgi:dihydropteroate synthase